MIIAALLIVVIFLLIPCQAIAWGGGIHLQTGISALALLDTFPSSVAAVLSANPRDFLYGCIAADIIVGKKYTHYMLNCHRWSIGQKILRTALTDSEKACAYGYLCHLAADTVAHNYYVPYKIMRSFATLTMKHAYWEMRFETVVPRHIWEVAQDVCRSDQRANDKLLRSVLSNTLFSFGTNKRIFDSIMLLSRLEKWQKVMQTLADNSRYQLAESDRDEYLSMTEDAVFDFLKYPQDSQLLLSDPTGEKALSVAEALRKNLRLLYRSGKLSKTDGLDLVDELKLKLRKAMHDPDILKELYDDIR